MPLTTPACVQQAALPPTHPLTHLAPPPLRLQVLERVLLRRTKVQQADVLALPPR